MKERAFVIPFRIFFLFLFVFTFSNLVHSAPSAVVDVKLTPAGSFKAKTDEVKGSANLKNGEVTAQNVVVNLQNLKTGMALRDKHTKEHLETDKFPEAVLSVGTGKDGIGSAKIKIRGIEKDISGTYKVEGQELISEFKLHLPDFNINDIKYLSIGVEDDVVVHVTIPILKAAAVTAPAENSDPALPSSKRSSKPGEKPAPKPKAKT